MADKRKNGQRLF